MEQPRDGEPAGPARPWCRRAPRLTLAVGGAIAALVGGGQYLRHAMAHESTDDAFIEAHVVTVSPKVASYVSRVRIDDNWNVRKGDPGPRAGPRHVGSARRQGPMINPWLIAVSVMLATFMEVLDTSVAAAALPYMAGSLSATNDESTWVLTSYLVSNAVMLPATGWLATRFGRKRLLTTCIAIFTVSSFACGAAVSLRMLIAARVLQGAGGGALQPVAQAILMETFPPAQRGVAMAVYGLGVVVAPILGPTLGGWITDNYSWRWIFFINIPIGVLATLMILTFVRDPAYIREARPGRLDALGLGLLVVSIGTLQIVLDRGQEADFSRSGPA